MQPLSSAVQLRSIHPGLEALEDGFCMLDADWKVTYWNAAAERMLGVEREQVLGHSVWHTFPFLRESVTWERLHQVREQQAPVRFLEMHPPGGARGFASVYASPLPDGEVAVHFRDATEEVKRAEQYSTLLESIRDGFIAVDPNWSIMYLNGVAESLLRFSRDQAMGLSLWSLLPREPLEIGEVLRATMDDGIQRHVREVRPAGRVFRGRVFDLWTYPLAGGGISVLFEDVSDRMQREKELARLAAEAQEANQAKSRFFAAISHELRTPLNAIVGYTHLLNTETYGPMPEGARRAAERAGICAEHLSRLVDDVLMLTTAEIGRLPVSPCPIVLQDFIDGVVEPLRHQALSKGLEFTVEIPADLPQVETDPQRLRQLLVSLLSNAVKFTSRGTVRLVVSLQGDGIDSEDTAMSDLQVEFAVSDTGPGVALQDRERIFGAFEQLGDPSRSQSMVRGTGLGLTIARQLSHLLRGSLYLAETSPAGSCFCLRLPLYYSVGSS